MIIAGVVYAGVERQCLMLGEFNIFGDISDIEPGDSIEAEGEIMHHYITTCMQGTPFHVTSYKFLID